MFLLLCAMSYVVQINLWLLHQDGQLNSESMVESVKSVIHNFNAGPSVLPREVFEQASRAVIDYNDTGLSILEIGHRTNLFEPVMAEARALVKELMQLGDEHEVLFLHGGATTQFMQVPMNLLNENELASYTDTGSWATK